MALRRNNPSLSTLKAPIWWRKKNCEVLLTSESLLWSAGSETPRTEWLGPWTAFATTSVLCVLHVNVSFCIWVPVWAIEVDSVFSPWCLLGPSQSPSSVTGDKACLLPRQEKNGAWLFRRGPSQLYLHHFGGATLNLHVSTQRELRFV